MRSHQLLFLDATFADSAAILLRHDLAAAVTMGLGVWAAHFIAMAAVESALTITYDLLLTGLSIVPAIGSGVVCIGVANRSSVDPWRIIPGGAAMGRSWPESGEARS
jgi:NO-binding membrane sensor protein with MHYT domain